MGAENPLLNFRCPVEVKDLLTLHARREGAEVGPMLRQWMGERLATERVVSLIKSVGLLEVMRRLSMPSPVMSNDTAPSAICTGQTSENFVRQGGELVLQGVSAGSSVLHGKHGKRG